MEFTPLPFSAGLELYQRQAAELLEAHGRGDEKAIRFFHEKLPRFLDEKIVWLPKDIPASEIQNAALTLADAELAIARGYDFRDGAALVEYVVAVSAPGSPVFLFESAAEAVITGDVAGLEVMLREHPELVRMRSTRITDFDPPAHRATLLHYVAANGVEGYRQKTPANAVAIAQAVLRAGAEVDSLADMYGGRCTTMSMLVSSCHPAKAGVQDALVETLVDFGASVEATGEGNWTSPLMTALIFGYQSAAETLVRRGARVNDLVAAAALACLSQLRGLAADKSF